MAYDPATYKVNLDTPQPDGRKGESPRNAFTKYNALVEALKNAPPAPSSTTTNNVPQWSNTTGGLKDGLAVTSSTIDDTAGKLMRVGDFGVGGNGISVDPSTNPGSGFYRSIVYPTTDGATGNYYYIHHRWDASSGGYGWELASHSNGGTLLYRSLVSGTYTSPEEIIHTGNTGLIVSSGNNGNGNWVQFADGTQICYFYNLQLTTTSGSNSYFYDGTWTFPKSFQNSNYSLQATPVYASSPDAGGSPDKRGSVVGISYSSSSVQVRNYVLDGMPVNGDYSIRCTVSAIGRWK